MIKTPNSFKPQCLFNISVQRTKGRGVDFSWFRIWSSGDACADLWTYSQMLIFRRSESLAILLVIANAINLNQVSLIWTAGNYPIHLEGTLSFSINHSVRLHQLHCVLVSAAAEWWMGVPQVHSPAVWLGAAGSSGNKWTGRVPVIWDMLSLNRSSPLHSQFSHLAASGVLGLTSISRIIFWVVLMCFSHRELPPALHAPDFKRTVSWDLIHKDHRRKKFLRVCSALSRETKREGLCIFLGP